MVDGAVQHVLWIMVPHLEWVQILILFHAISVIALQQMLQRLHATKKLDLILLFSVIAVQVSCDTSFIIGVDR